MFYPYNFIGINISRQIHKSKWCSNKTLMIVHGFEYERNLFVLNVFKSTLYTLIGRIISMQTNCKRCTKFKVKTIENCLHMDALFILVCIPWHSLSYLLSVKFNQIKHCISWAMSSLHHNDHQIWLFIDFVVDDFMWLIVSQILRTVFWEHRRNQVWANLFTQIQIF